MQIQDFFHALLVLQDLLHARFLEGGVAGCEQRDIAKMADGAHDLLAEIADGLVELVHRPVLFLLDSEKRFLSIDIERVEPARSTWDRCNREKRKREREKKKEKEK